MNKLMIAIAAAVVLPAAALAQAAPAATPATDRAGHMQGMVMQNVTCKDMKAEQMPAGHSGHSAMDQGKMDHWMMASCRATADAAGKPADSRATHKQ